VRTGGHDDAHGVHLILHRFRIRVPRHAEFIANRPRLLRIRVHHSDEFALWQGGVFLGMKSSEVANPDHGGFEHGGFDQKSS
jgi:hypothetical protein